MNFVYEKELARDYDLKRKKPWQPLISFLNLVKDKYSLYDGKIIDLGCGNGRNFQLFNSKYLIGIDNSSEFLEIARKKKNEENGAVQFILSDMKKLPLREASIDSIFSIAALHHVKSNKARQLLVNQLHGILKNGGFLMVTVWRRYQRRFRKHFIFDWLKRILSSRYKKLQRSHQLDDYGDILIPWKVSSLEIPIKRYYHLFSKLELKKEFFNFKKLEIRKTGGPTKKDNFFALFKK